MAAIVFEDFNTSDNGWSVNGDGRNFTHVPQTGTTGGYITADDGVQGVTWYYTGGTAFTGDLSEFAGGTLRYSLRQTADSNQYDDIDVIIEGASRSIALDFPVEENPGTDFTDYTFDLNGAQGWFDLTTQAVLTDAEIETVLEDVQLLQIRGEYREGADTSELDSVSLNVADSGIILLPAIPPNPIRDGFAGSDDGWTLTQDGTDLTWFPEGGKTNGYLQGSDAPSGGTWYFRTPDGFAGDYASYLNGSISYSMLQRSLSSQFDDSDDAEVKLIGADRTLAFNVDSIDDFPGLDWTDYTVALNDTANWSDFETEVAVTTSEIAEVLATLQAIEIRGEYKSGGDTAGLDDFALLGQGQLLEDFANLGSIGDDNLIGDDAAESFTGGAGADIFTPGGGDDTIDGGSDTDTLVLAGDRDEYTVQITPDGVIVTDRSFGRDGTDTLIDVERIDFAGDDTPPNTLDLTVFADFATLEQADFETFVEMYIAYFNRAPDALGLYFWGTVLAKGDLTLEGIAADFFNQPETQAAYPDLSDNIAFASQVYENVLGRQFDQEGLDFWVGVLDSGARTKEQFILDILAGVDALPPAGSSAEFIAQKAADAAYLENKTDLGVYFAVELGMSDVNDASDAMALFDGTEASITAARAAMDADYAEVLNTTEGGFLMQLTGVFDDGMAM